MMMCYPDHVQTDPLLRGEGQSENLSTGPKILCQAKEVANQTLTVQCLLWDTDSTKGQGDSKPHKVLV